MPFRCFFAARGRPAILLILLINKLIFKPFIRLFCLKTPMTQYDKIGKSYSEMIRVDPVKIFVQRPSALALLGNVKEKSVLDIGCGDGIISRMLAKEGGKVVGFDPSKKLIASARSDEEKSPLGIKYFVADIQGFVSKEKFGAALAVMVLCFAKSEDELQDFFNKIYFILNKGAVLSVVDINGSALFPEINYYGRKFLFSGKKPIGVEWHVPGAPVSRTYANYFPKNSYMNCAKKAGFQKVTLTPIAPNKEGVNELGVGYWKEFAEKSVWFGLHAVK